MSDDALVEVVSAQLAPYADQLGDDLTGYTNHVVRVLLLCDAIHSAAGGEGPPPTQRKEYLTCGVFHDLGIWTDRTFDYLAPSIALATDHLRSEGREDLAPLVSRMIDEHHKVRDYGGPDDPVEIFRRADTIDVVFGLRRFGLPRATVRSIRRKYRDAGFHLLLVKLSLKRAAAHPTSPLPMFKW